MPFNIDTVFDLPARSMALGSQRMELLAANIANADTPDYLSRDIDFDAAMQAQNSKASRMAATQPGHIRSGGDNGPAEVMYRIPMQPAQDGNTVDTQREKASVAETAIRYQTSLTILNMRIRGLKLAITGGR